MIGDLMDVELARQQWEDGRRRVERSRPGSPESGRLAREVELIVAEIRRRVGQSFTLEELASAYDGAGEWARDVLYEARPDGAPPPETATVTDAAFQVYARGASDYRP
jgi:hypothetical protein